MTTKPSPLNGDFHRDANIKALKKLGLLIRGLHCGPHKSFEFPGASPDAKILQDPVYLYTLDQENSRGVLC